ncbi:hypothetical protein EJB05_07372 [Eragrostis curvula]|uniref:Uncharacterized protein n=1 Tax=Eragrostis curvula TaxID=38414 RepID=A0A5J9WI76_9POAL|nr:hypothetical protein EJB05_07372 [Eragrostis curvula]
MSRCFPYPPPGYVRNPVAVAEAESTAKLQKEREKAEKKKEKRSDRKALQQGETSKHKHGHKKRKHQDIGPAGQEPKKVSKETVEQLEKSGLSEEHGAPCFAQTVRDSPESSQDSSKRRKVVPSPSQAKNGNILRIKIKRDQDSPRGVLEKPMVLAESSIKQMGLGSSQFSKPNSVQQPDTVIVKSSAVAHQRINVEPQAIQRQASTQLPGKFTRRDDPQTAKVVQQIDPRLSVRPPVGRVDPQPARVMGRVDPVAKMAQRNLPAKSASAKVLPRVDPQVPSNEIQRKCPPATKVLQEASTSIRPLEVLQPSPVQNSKLEVPVINQLQRPIASLPKEEPSSSGRNAEAVKVKEAKQSKSDRKSRKAEKKEKKFTDLFVTWNPPSFEMEDSDIGGQDWLLGSTRNSDARMTNCRASDGSVPFQSMEQQPSLQPRATFLPDLHIYQLPYVVPF